MITREEMIELLGRVERILGPGYKGLPIADDIANAKAALQAAEPKSWFTEDYNEDRSATTYSLEVAARIEAQYG